MSQSAPKDRSISFTVDGQTFQVDEAKQLVADILGLAGLDPSGYNLGEIRGGRPEPKLLRDDDRITVQDGDEFVSIREDAPVA